MSSHEPNTHTHIHTITKIKDEYVDNEEMAKRKIDTNLPLIFWQRL